MPYLVLSPQDRAALAGARADVWKGALSTQEFVRRNERLYAHPFGQTRMKSFGLPTDGKIGASLDVLQTGLLIGDGKGGVREATAWHIASVLTLPEYRGQGLASRLLQAYLTTERPEWNTLFSGIGPRFYERFGFRASEFWQYSRPPLAGLLAGTATPISLTEFLAAQHAERKEKLRLSPVPACAFHLDILWWDWYGALYQFFAEIRGFTAPRGRFWRLETPEETVHLAALESRAAGCLDLWWASSHSDSVLDFLAAQAGALGLPQFRWWSPVEHPEKKPKREVPMVRSAADAASLPLLDAQMGEWW